MMHITNNVWKDTIRQIVEEDSAAYSRDGLGVVPAGFDDQIPNLGECTSHCGSAAS